MMSPTQSMVRKEITPSATTAAWLRSGEGQAVLRERAAKAAGAFREAGLLERLRRERESAREGGNKVYRIGNSLRGLMEERMVLALARQWGVDPEPEVEEVAGEVLERVLGLDSLVFQGQTATPHWKADLWTADLGLSLAFIASAGPEADAERIAAFVEERCWKSIVADWLDDGTRIHSLDSMGHNWWSVIVGGGGAAAALLGWRERALEAGRKLEEWFRYPGNETFRKQPNFGPEGDYVESFAYGEYALLRPFTLALLLPEWSLVPGCLSPEACRGLAAWYKRAFVRTREGWWPQRFGDIQLSYRPYAAVWHTLARLTGDGELIALAHAISPRPGTAFDLLMWEPLPEGERERQRERQRHPDGGVRHFPVSGMAFLEEGTLSVAARAGEFWNHNHLDAGSFTLCQDEVVWVDDSGTCKYSAPEYTQYYTSPQAHNVAFAPDLAPPNAQTQYLGQDGAGRFLSTGKAGRLAVAEADTRVLSGGRLARSRRRFLALGGEALVVWDDLEAYGEEAFEFRLHTARTVRPEGDGLAGTLADGEGKTCRYAFFSDTSSVFSSEPAAMGEIAPHDPFLHGEAEGTLEGTCLRWRGAEKTGRRKFALAMGTRLESVLWTALESGWEARVKTAEGEWSLWFNLLADGRIAHTNTRGTWRGIETDAAVLVLHEGAEESVVAALDASFVRRDGEVLHGSLAREGVVWRVLTSGTSSATGPGSR